MILLIVALLLVAICFPVGKKLTGSKDPAERIGGKIFYGVGSIAPIVLVTIASWTTVPAGHVGVVVLFGDVEDTPLEAGAHFINPLVNVVKMNVQVQAREDNLAAASKDLQEVNLILGSNYRLTAATAPRIYREIGIDWASVIIPNAEQEVAKAEMANHNASEILQNRASIKDAIQADIAEWLGKYGIALVEVSMRNIDFSDDYTKAIEEKQVQEQRALQKTYELQSAEKQAEITKAQAAGVADAAIEAARGAADAQRLKADAEAYHRTVTFTAKADTDAYYRTATSTAEANANLRLAESLSGTDGARVLQLHQIQKWAGTVPGVVMSGSPTMLLDLKEISK
jgi:regulator of protease activity HflC (stomatin/prohibitin superfamily)